MLLESAYYTYRPVSLSTKDVGAASGVSYNAVFNCCRVYKASFDRRLGQILLSFIGTFPPILKEYAMRTVGMEKIARRALIWVLVYSIPTFQSILPVDDPDLWWHLRTGQWILQHGYVPMVDTFSTYGMGKPWIAYSWLFEIIIYVIYSMSGLIGIVIFTMLMSLLIALTVHALIRRAQLPFVIEITLMAVALGSMKPVISPRSWLFSILFFAVELLVVFNVRRSGKTILLWTLPPLFAIWANFHIQFIYGLAVIGFLLAEVIFNRFYHPKPVTKPSASIQLAPLFGVAIASILAIFLTPYHYHLLRPILEISTQTGAFLNVSELHPLFFRSPADWFVLGLTLIAVFVLGWERKWQMFPLLLLLMGVALGFRARRDAWVVVLTAVAIVGYFRSFDASKDEFSITKPRILGIAAAILFFAYLIGDYRGITKQRLQIFVEQRFPAKAVDFIIENRLSGPLFNNFDWGGYLIWRLHNLPVSIDNRMNVHGDDRIERSLATWAGYEGWRKDPELATARLVVAELWRPLVSLLRADPRFKLVYQDSTAAVFVAAGDLR